MSQDSTKSIKLEQKYCPKCYGQFEGAIEVCPSDGAELRGPKNDPLIGKVFAERYEIESVLGLGGMSIVYKARHRLMDRVVAIKMLHGNIKSDHLSLERFRLEAQAASSLNHQNIITVYDFGVTPQSEAFFVMDFLDGESLADCLERKTKLPWERAIGIFKQICDGLGAAHKKGIVHRDMKPANVVLIKQDEGFELVKLVDFGIAKLLPASGKQQQSLTKTGEVFGSPIYMSPEQCLGKDVDRHSDIYALGCLMYETLTGVPPHLGATFLETLNKHVGEKPKPIHELAPDAKVPVELERIIDRCLEKKPEDRFDTAEEIRDHLSAVSLKLNELGTKKRAAVSGPMSSLSDTPTFAQAAAECKPPSPVWKIVAGVTSLFIVGVFAALTMFQGPPEDRGSALDKLTWTINMSVASSQVQSGDFQGAERSINNAIAATNNISDAKTRLEAALRQKADLYAKWEGHAEALEKTNVEITNVQDERIRNELARQIASLIVLERATKSSGKAEDTSVSHTNDQLRAQADVPSILATSSKLYGRRMYHDQVDYLLRALNVEKKLIGDKEPPIARIEVNLSDGLIALRRFSEVRPILLDAVEIRKANAKSDPSEYVRALSKLGQFDLDQSSMKDAEAELAEALKLSRDKSVDPELQVLSLRSYADLLRQTKRVAESKKYLDEADALEKKIHDRK
ncbi:MAG: serine/threonine protein kinase [Candidatus Melainabacteria bacterium]|nr:MAG: serine/threonine protein kinase [Candidatus Melainabacteria bacterium]